VPDINKHKKGGLAKTHQNCAKVVQEYMHFSDLADYLEEIKPGRTEIHLQALEKP